MVLLVQNKFTFTPSENALIIIMNVPRSIRKPRKTSSLLHQVKARYNSYEYSSFYIPITQNKFAFTPSKSALYFSFYQPTSTRRYRQGTGNIEKTNDKLLFIHLVKNYHNYFSTPQEENKSRLGEKKKVGISNIKLTNITALAAKVTLI